MIVLSERAKRLLLITLGIAAFCGAAFAIYVLFFRTPAPQLPTDTQTPTVTPGTLPGAGTAVPGTDSGTGQTGTLPTGSSLPGQAPTGEPSRSTVLIDEGAAFAQGPSSNQQGVRFYNERDGKFYRLTDNGELIPLSDNAFYGVQNVDWGKRDNKAILEFPDGSNVLYDFTEQRQVTLPKHWEDFAFSPDDQQIVTKSVGNNENNRFLVVANPDGTNPVAVQELGNNAHKVSTTWSPKEQVIAYAFTGDPQGFDREQVILVGKNNENFPGLITEGRGFSPNWSPSGEGLLYSVYTSSNGFLPELWITSGDASTINNGRRRLSLNTWAEKCTWNGDQELYCAVPEFLEPGAALQPQAVTQGRDQLYRINARTGVKTNLGPVDGAQTIRQITISPDGASAILVDSQTNAVIRYRLR